MKNAPISLSKKPGTIMNSLIGAVNPSGISGRLGFLFYSMCGLLFEVPLFIVAINDPARISNGLSCYHSGTCLCRRICLPGRCDQKATPCGYDAVGNLIGHTSLRESLFTVAPPILFERRNFG